eukprot:6193955-Pleurochrysis_carterae.AAC.1
MHVCARALRSLHGRVHVCVCVSVCCDSSVGRTTHAEERRREGGRERKQAGAGLSVKKGERREEVVVVLEVEETMGAGEFCASDSYPRIAPLYRCAPRAVCRTCPGKNFPSGKPGESGRSCTATLVVDPGRAKTSPMACAPSSSLYQPDKVRSR